MALRPGANTDLVMNPGKLGAARAARQLTELALLLSGMAAAHHRLALQYLGLHKATAKLGYVTTSLSAGVIASGFCTADSREATEDGDSRCRGFSPLTAFAHDAKTRSPVCITGAVQCAKDA